MKPSDLQVLRALLSQPDGVLSVSERRVFQRMYDDVASGMVIQLSKKQRAWIDGAYAKLKNEGKLKAPTKTVEVKDKQLARKGPTPRTDLLRKARELGLSEPIPDDKLDLLSAVLSAAERAAITRRAVERGTSVEAVTAAYVRKLLGA